MIPRRADELARIVGGRLAGGDPARSARGAALDSRTVAPGEAFFAIRGAKHDGHDYIGDAVARGAAIVVVQQEVSPPGGAALVRVDDTTKALGRLAADERGRRQLVVVAVTGSSGKTTTRLLTKAALSARLRTAASEGNLNNQWGLPLSVLRLPDEAEAAVLELAMNHQGEIAALTAIAAPDVGVITNVGTAHIGLLGGTQQIAAAKAELLYGLPPTGVAVVHAGSPELAAHVARAQRRTIRFGFEDDADIVPRAITTDVLRGASFTVDDAPVRLMLWGRHAVLNAAAALGAARAVGLSPAEAAPALASVAPLEGRGRVLWLRGGVALVDEVYNANPTAMETVLQGLADAPWPGRRVAILGDMLELGEFALEQHRRVGRSAARWGVGALHAVGEFAGEVARAAREGGVPNVHTYIDADAAAHAVPGAVTAGDLVVIKGSRGLHLESVRDALVAARREQDP